MRSPRRGLLARGLSVRGMLALCTWCLFLATASNLIAQAPETETVEPEPSESRKRIEITKGKIPLKTLLRIVASQTGEILIFPSATNDPSFAEDVLIEVLEDIDNVTFEIAKKLLDTNGYVLWQTELEDGTRVYNVRSTQARGPQPDQTAQQVWIIPDPEKIPDEGRSDELAILVVQLRYVDSASVTNTLKDLLDFQGANSPSGDKMVQLPNNDTVIFKAKISLLRHIKTLIKYIDVEAAGPDQILEVRDLDYADALDMVELLRQALDNTGARRTGRTVGARRGAAANTGAAGASQVGEGTTLIPDTRTQKVIIQSTSPEEVGLVHTLIDELDSRVRNTRAKTHVYQVKFLKAEDLQPVLSSLIDGTNAATARGNTRGRGATGRGQAGAAGNQLQPSRIVPHNETNSLLIQAEPEEYEEIVGILKRIDRKRRQVFLEAALVQVSDASSLNYTFEYLAGDLDDEATRFAALSAFGLSALDVTQLPDSFNRAFLEGAPSTGLFAAVSADGQLPVLLRAIKRDTNSQILATPFILADDNQQNLISVQTTIFFEQTAQGQVTATTSQDSENAGITLTLLPTISESVVLLELTLEVSSFATASSGSGALPDRNENRIESRVTIPDGEVFVIGGLARENESLAVDKIPLLGDLPLIGRFFQSRAASKSRDNLYVFLTAHIIDEKTYTDIRHFTRQAREDIKTFGDDLRIKVFEPVQEPIRGGSQQ